MRNIKYVIIVIALSLIFSACGKKNENKTDKTKEVKSSAELVNKGKEIFYSESKETNLKCADCHSDGTNDANPLTKFYSSIKGAHKRTSVLSGLYIGNEVLKNASGASYCWKTFLKYEEPLTDTQINSLIAFYESVSRGDEPQEIKYQSIALPKPDKVKLKEDQGLISQLKGDINKGENIYNNACKYCHGDDSKIKKVPSLLKDFDGNMKSIAYHIRIGVKIMPFYSYEKMNNQDIADVTEFIMSKVKK